MASNLPESLYPEMFLFFIFVTYRHAPEKNLLTEASPNPGRRNLASRFASKVLLLPPTVVDSLVCFSARKHLLLLRLPPVLWRRERVLAVRRLKS
jgi:hypothetical protein